MYKFISGKIIPIYKQQCAIVEIIRNRIVQGIDRQKIDTFKKRKYNNLDYYNKVSYMSINTYIQMCVCNISLKYLKNISLLSYNHCKYINIM